MTMNLSNKNAERHTLARAAAESDIRNLVSFAAANHWMISHCNHKLFINADATQFQVGGSLKQTMKVKAYNGRTRPDKVLPSENENLTSYFIKYYGIISLGGYVADPIFIVADESMSKDTIDVYDISGLGIGADPANKGHLVICKDRSLCVSFYRWMINECLVGFAK